MSYLKQTMLNINKLTVKITTEDFNVTSQTRKSILDGQDIGNKIISFNFKQTQVSFFVYDLAKSLIKFKSIKTTCQQRRFR